MRKSAPVALLAAGFLIFAGVFSAAPAHADDDEEEEGDTSSEVFEFEDNGKVEIHLPKPADELKRKELEQKYGKDGKLSLPPLVIRPMRDTDGLIADSDDAETTVLGVSPGDATDSKVFGAGAKYLGSEVAITGSSNLGVASVRFIAINPTSAGSLAAAGGVATGRQVNPEQSVAIDISNVNFTRRTPADAFIQTSQVGLYAMAAGSIALAIVAASRTIRRK